MPILSNAKKALRASRRKAVYNQIVKSRVKTASDAVQKNPTMEKLVTAYSAIDTATKRNVFHKNKAARLKSQLAQLVKPTKLEKPPKKARKATKTAKSIKKPTKPAKKTAKKRAAKKQAAKKTSPKKKTEKK